MTVPSLPALHPSHRESIVIARCIWLCSPRLERKWHSSISYSDMKITHFCDKYAVGFAMGIAGLGKVPSPIEGIQDDVR